LLCDSCKEQHSSPSYLYKVDVELPPHPDGFKVTMTVIKSEKPIPVSTGAPLTTTVYCESFLFPRKAAGMKSVDLIQKAFFSKVLFQNPSSGIFKRNPQIGIRSVGEGSTEPLDEVQTANFNKLLESLLNGQ